MAPSGMDLVPENSLSKWQSSKGLPHFWGPEIMVSDGYIMLYPMKYPHYGYVFFLQPRKIIRLLPSFQVDITFPSENRTSPGAMMGAPTSLGTAAGRRCYWAVPPESAAVVQRIPSQQQSNKGFPTVSPRLNVPRDIAGWCFFASPVKIMSQLG